MVMPLDMFVAPLIFPFPGVGNLHADLLVQLVRRLAEQLAATPRAKQDVEDQNLV